MSGGAGWTGQPLHYRSDIDGLRALSVVMVMAFHLMPWLVPGGIVGVDVFFVISGYLISGIVLEDLRAGKFTIAGFYVRRIRRIVPALLTMIVTVLGVGCFVLLPGDLKEVSLSALAAITGLSNIYFFHNTGYFDIAAEMLPLLHTWSLGIEEQFYFVWPLLMLGLFKAARGNRGVMAVVLVLVIAASFAMSLRGMQTNPKRVFYMVQTRAWELGLGALLLFAPPLKTSRAAGIAGQGIAFAGLAMIIAASVTLRQSQPYPGSVALLPVVGAALAIYNGGGATFVSALLSLQPIVFLGRISYSLYLWHWPLLVYWRHLVNGEQLTGAEAATIAVVSLIVAVLSWRFIEVPSRKWRPGNRSVFAAYGSAVALVGSIVLPISISEGWASRVPIEVRGIASLKAMRTWQCPRRMTLPIAEFGNVDLHIAACQFGRDWDGARNKVLLWGDSNAEHFIQILDDVGRRTDSAFVAVTPCPPIIGAGYWREYVGYPYYMDRCRKQWSTVIAWLRGSSQVTHVMLAARWSGLDHALRSEALSDTRSGADLLEPALHEVLAQVSGNGRIAVIVNDMPEVSHESVARCVASRSVLLRARRCTNDLDDTAYRSLNTFQSNSHDIIRKVAQRIPDVYAVSPEYGLCANFRCATVVAGEFIYRDGIHLRRNLRAETTRALGELLGFERLLQQVPSGSWRN